VVSNEEIKRMLEAKRRGVNINKSDNQSENYKICPYCKSKNPEKSIFCVKCGKKLDKNFSIKCPSCETMNAKDAKFCVQCGKNLQTEVNEEISQKNTIDIEKVDNKVETSTNDLTKNPLQETSKSDKTESEKPVKPIPVIKVPSTVPEHDIISKSSTKKICISCKSKNLKNAKFCVVCGEKFEDNLKENISKDTTEKNYEKSSESVVKKSVASKTDDPIEKIKKAKELLDMGAITSEEFENIKKKYLEKI